jgi:hypothetical protein
MSRRETIRKPAGKASAGKQAPSGQAGARDSAAGALKAVQAGDGATAQRAVHTLGRAAGNRAVSRLLQAKLQVGPANDRYEQEADRVAEHVMRAPSLSPDDLGHQPPGIQRLPQAAAPEAGFQAPASIEDRLAAAGGGRPLPGATRAIMEARLGADLSSVRVHTGPQAVQLSRDLKARAFTHRSHIYFGDGEYNPGSSAGQRLLAHELTHTMQQGASPLRQQRAPAGPAAVQASRQASASLRDGTLQLKQAVVSTSTRSRLVDDGLGSDPKANVKKVAKGKRGPSYDKFSTIELMDSDWFYVRNEKGEVAWYRVKNIGQNEYVLASNVLAGFSSAGDFNRPHDKTKKDDDGGGMSGTDYAWSATKATMDIANAVDDPVLERVRLEDLKKVEYDAAVKRGETPTGPAPEGSSASLLRGEGGLWLTAGILGMAVSMKDLLDDEKSAWEKIDAALNWMGSGMAVTGAISQIVATHQSDDSNAVATGVGAFSFAFQDMFSALAAGVKTIKGVVDLVKMVVDTAQGSKHTRNEWVEKSGGLLQSGLETAKGVLRTIRGINEAISGSVGTQFGQVLPGLDIAIAAVKSIMQGYDLAVSAVEMHRMSQMEKAQMSGLEAESGYTKEDIKKARKDYRTQDAQASQLDRMIAEKEAKITSLTAKRDKIPQGGSEKEQKKRDALEAKIKALETKKSGYEAKRTSNRIDSDLYDEARVKRGSGPSRAEVEEIALANALKTTNKRRIVRQSVHIGTNLVQIGASIAALVSGPGAPGAIALKAAAAGIDMSLPFFRWLKQRGRETAARNVAKGQTGLSNKIFNADKSDAAKLQARKKQAVLILKMVARLNTLMSNPQALAAQAKRVESYISATGLDTQALYKLNGKPQAQINLLVKGLAQRELGGD